MAKKVLFFINSEVGGAERMSVLISKILIKGGLKVEYAIIKDKMTAASITDFLPHGYNVTYIKADNPADKIRIFYHTIKQHKPDVVFSSHLAINDKLLLLKPFFKEIKFIIRSDNYYNTYRFVSKLFIKATYGLANAMIAQTDEMKDEFVKHRIIPEKKIFVLENPVDKESIDEKLKNADNPYPADGKKHIVAVGRFSYQKGYDYLVQAIEQVIRQQANCELYIIGAYTEKWKQEYDRIATLILKLGIKESVHCIGYQNNPYKWIKYADCFVLSSRWEGLPNVLAEALYLGTPVAAFKCIPIIERMVRDEIDGFLAEKKDASSLATAISKTIGLGRISTVYTGATNEDFLKIFI